MKHFKQVVVMARGLHCPGQDVDHIFAGMGGCQNADDTALSRDDRAGKLIALVAEFPRHQNALPLNHKSRKFLRGESERP